jgi:hypothetical protein
MQGRFKMEYRLFTIVRYNYRDYNKDLPLPRHPYPWPMVGIDGLRLREDSQHTTLLPFTFTRLTLINTLVYTALVSYATPIV